MEEPSLAMKPLDDFVGRPYKLLLGSDHGGFALKAELAAWLRARGVAVEDVGPHTLDPQDDYPDYACIVGRRVARGEAQAGILICRAGIGMCITANRFPGVRAALARTPALAQISREHNCSNILVTGGDDLTADALKPIVEAWLATPFTNAARHVRRLEKVEQLTYDDIAPLRAVDPEVAAAIDEEACRQEDSLVLIASENITSPAVRAATGSCMTNKYAEGYPGKRYYGGCAFVDEAERLAIERAKQLFGAEAVNVQPHSGSQANMAVYFALLEPGDRVLAMNLSHGGHLTHGMKLNFSGRMYDFVSYGVNPQTERLDYDEIAALARQHRPKLLLAGASAYPRTIDFPRLRQIADEVGAYLMVDMAHIAGLVAANVHPSPVPYADVVTSTTHKTLRGPRGGLILCREKYLKKLNSQVFPGLQGGPLMHVIAGKAVCFHEALQPGFRAYQQQVVTNAAALAAALVARGFRLVSGGTDNHLVLVDLRSKGTTGNLVEVALDRAGLTTNKNLIPFDPEKPTITSGLRLGTPAVTTRGLGADEVRLIAAWIDQVVGHLHDEAALAAVRAEVLALCRRFPLPRL